MKRLYFLLALLLLTTTPIYTNDKVEDILNSNSIKESIIKLQKLYLSSKNNIIKTKALIALTKIYLNNNDLKNAKFILKILKEKGDSSLSFYYNYLYSVYLFKTQNFYESADHAAIFIIKAPQNLKIYGLNIFKESLKKLDLNQLEQLKDKYKDYDVLYKNILFYLIKNSYEKGNFSSVEKLSTIFLSLFSSDPLSEIVKKYLEKSKELKGRYIKIAVLLPLSGEYKVYGEQVLNSIKLKFSEIENDNIKYSVFDTKSSPIETIFKVKEILKYGDYTAIVGPITSLNTIVASALVSEYSLPLITPTATEEGIAKIGNNIFQLNVTITKLAEKIAKFAVDSLKLRKFVIIAPDNAYGRTQALSFQRYVEAKGGRIIKLIIYPPGTKDYKEYMISIRRAILIDKIEEEIFKKEGKYREVKLENIPKKRLKEENLQVDGIFIPSASADELIMLIPQIFYYRINGTLLGSSGWYSNKLIKHTAQYLNNSYFSLYFYKIDRYDKRIKFENEYKNMFKKSPGKVSYLGYDAIDIIFSAIENGYTTPEAITEYINNIKNYNGVSGRITFYNTEGSNNNAEIIKIENKKFIKLNY